MRISDGSSDVCSSDLALVAELALVLARGDPLEDGARLLLDDERRDALLGASGEGHDRGPLAVGDPRLGAVQDVLVAVADRLAGEVLGVAPSVRLGQRQSAAPLAGGHRREQALLLLVAAVVHHERGAHGRSEEHTTELQSLMRISY